MRYHVLLVALVVLSSSVFPGALRAQTEPKLDALTLQRAVDELKVALDERWSYRRANSADFDVAIEALRTKITAGLSINEFGIEVHKIIALGIDGHSGVAGYRLPGSRYLPFLIEPDGQRFVAFNSERTAFLAPEFPYVTHIDGRDVTDWCAAATALVPKGSPQYVRHRCLARLRDLDFVRGLMNLTERDAIDVALTSRDGNRKTTLTLRAATAPLQYGAWPRAGSRVLDNNVGYLRLTNMVAEQSVNEIKDWMPKFRETRGLVIDVRDNTGGDRDALRWVYSYLAAPNAPPRVFNVAAYRLYKEHPDDYLATNHVMYRAGASQWSEAQKRAVAEFAKTFKPAWSLPAGEFSDLHYMALERINAPEVYYYDKPTIVLMNGKSFSATDNFLAGLKGVTHVTLMGTPSAGGSAYVREVTLGSTPIRILIGSIVSFQADGRLFDGQGVRPDVLLEPTPEYYIGGPDTVLDEATKRFAAHAVER